MTTLNVYIGQNKHKKKTGINPVKFWSLGRQPPRENKKEKKENNYFILYLSLICLYLR